MLSYKKNFLQFLLGCLVFSLFGVNVHGVSLKKNLNFSSEEAAFSLFLDLHEAENRFIVNENILAFLKDTFKDGEQWTSEKLHPFLSEFSAKVGILYLKKIRKILVDLEKKWFYWNEQNSGFLNSYTKKEILESLRKIENYIYHYSELLSDLVSYLRAFSKQDDFEFQYPLFLDFLSQLTKIPLGENHEDQLIFLAKASMASENFYNQVKRDSIFNPSPIFSRKSHFFLLGFSLMTGGTVVFFLKKPKAFPTVLNAGKNAVSKGTLPFKNLWKLWTDEGLQVFLNGKFDGFTEWVKRERKNNNNNDELRIAIGLFSFNANDSIIEWYTNEYKSFSQSLFVPYESLIGLSQLFALNAGFWFLRELSWVLKAFINHHRDFIMKEWIWKIRRMMAVHISSSHEQEISSSAMGYFYFQGHLMLDMIPLLRKENQNLALKLLNRLFFMKKSEEASKILESLLKLS